MKWKQINNPHEDMPKDRVFLSLWKYRVSLTEYDADLKKFWIIYEPAGYQECHPVETLYEDEFTHWMDLPFIPQELYE